MAIEILSALLRANLAGGAAILLVLASRGAARHAAGARAAYALWLAVPVAMGAVLLPARTVLAPAALSAPAAGIVAPIAAAGAADVGGGGTADAGMYDGAVPGLAAIGLVVWIAGAAGAAGVMMRRQRAFVASLGGLAAEAGEARTLRAGADGVGPAIIGAVRPRLVLPRDFEAQFDAPEREMVLAVLTG
jgi:beta-lactamase regulating signal transducer with metallopeptidase domain